jgi:hypothetical protein
MPNDRHDTFFYDAICSQQSNPEQQFTKPKTEATKPGQSPSKNNQGGRRSSNQGGRRSSNQGGRRSTGTASIWRASWLGANG